MLKNTIFHWVVYFTDTPLYHDVTCFASIPTWAQQSRKIMISINNITAISSVASIAEIFKLNIQENRSKDILWYTNTLCIVNIINRLLNIKEHDSLLKRKTCAYRVKSSLYGVPQPMQNIAERTSLTYCSLIMPLVEHFPS